jgi:hypothetical protein
MLTSKKKLGKPSVQNFYSTTRVRVMLSCLIVTGDEMWVYCYDPALKRQSMEWHHQMSLHKKNFV